MGWDRTAGDWAGDEPGSGFGLPHQDLPSAVPRDERLAGFAPGGEWDTCPPSAELAAVLAAVSDPQWRSPGATDDEKMGLVRCWTAIESWASAGKLGSVRDLIRGEDKPWQPADKDVDRPTPWSESLTHDLALGLASSVGSADRMAWLAWELGTRLPGIEALLTDATLTYGKAKAIAEAFQHLSDVHAAQAEALILGQLKGKTYLQVLRLAATAASRVDPEGDERRRKDAERHAARVRLWREQSGAAALAGFDLPPDETLAAYANVSARAEQYQASEAFPGAQLDQLRAMAYLDLLNGLTAETRISGAMARAASTSPAAAPGDEAPGSGPAANPSTEPGSGKPRTDLIVPLFTLLGLGNRPGAEHRFGTLDPALCRDLVASAANHPASAFCLTVTNPDGIAIGHGCARMTRSTEPAVPVGSRAGLPARVNLTITQTDLRNLGGQTSRGSPWSLTRQANGHAPPGGHGTWTLVLPGGREFTVRLEGVPTFACDHARESHAYRANDPLRHLVQVRDGECTFPSCTRHARESDFEHAVPYDKGGRTCACNAGARSRRCHRIKQSPGWTVTQPRPGFHQWTTPTGRTYTQEPKRYPV